MGLHRAGFDVTGVDIRRQPRYPFRFAQADALRPPFDLGDFDFIWASPPCQAFTTLRTMPRHGLHPDLIEPVRLLLKASGAHWIIENVPGAPIRSDFALTGSEFGLKVVRRRHFESSFWSLHPFPWKPRSAIKAGYQTVTGHAGGSSKRDGIIAGNTDARREAMGIDWMTAAELVEAVPPAYAEFIGRAAIALLSERVAA